MSGKTPDADTYALRTTDVPEIDAPILNYRPPVPRAEEHTSERQSLYRYAYAGFCL